MNEFASNWNRWGAEDQRGTLNLLTPERVIAASDTVGSGQVISLARVIRHDIIKLAERVAPTLVLTADGGDYAAGAGSPNGPFTADDFIAMPLATGTHLDGLAHVWSVDGMYNGHDGNLVRSRGAKVNGIENVTGIVARGVLADICKLHGVDALEASHTVTVEELEAATAGAGTPVTAGDALLIRTGWLTDASLTARGGKSGETQEPGIGMEGAAWIAEKDVAVVGCDNWGVERFPAPEGGTPVHVALISKLGAYLIEVMDLEELAGVVDGPFLFVVAPLRLRGAVNSPINPLAIL